VQRREFRVLYPPIVDIDSGSVMASRTPCCLEQFWDRLHVANGIPITIAIRWGVECCRLRNGWSGIVHAEWVEMVLGSRMTAATARLYDRNASRRQCWSRAGRAMLGSVRSQLESARHAAAVYRSIAKSADLTDGPHASIQFIHGGLERWALRIVR